MFSNLAKVTISLKVDTEPNPRLKIPQGNNTKLICYIEKFKIANFMCITALLISLIKVIVFFTLTQI